MSEHGHDLALDGIAAQVYEAYDGGDPQEAAGLIGTWRDEWRKAERERVLAEVQAFADGLLTDSTATAGVPGQSLMARYLLKAHQDLQSTIAGLRGAADRSATTQPHATISVTCSTCGKPWALGQRHACQP